MGGVRQRHDHVIVHLRNGRAVSVKSLNTFLIGLKYGIVRFGIIGFHPRHKRGPEIETDLSVIVRDLLDHTFGIQNTRCAVGPVTFSGHTLIPIVIRMCGILNFDNFQPGILTGRLVEMPVNTDIFFQDLNQKLILQPFR